MSVPPGFTLDGFERSLVTSAHHKHLFTSRTEAGELLGSIRRTLDAYADLGIALSDVYPVAVVYHAAAITLGFNDKVWNEYFLPLVHAGKTSIVDAGALGPGISGNPYLVRKDGSDDASIPGLIAATSFRIYICNNATHGYADAIATHLKKSAADVYATLAANLVPSAMLVPAGVWAVNAVQEHQFTLLQVS